MPLGRRGRLALRWALILAGLYVGVAVIFAAFQRRLIYPRPSAAAVPERPGAALLRIPSADLGYVLAFHRPAQLDAPTLVWFHGNGEQLASDVDLFERFASRGLGILGVEYPGYGLAPGEPGETALYSAGAAALEHLRSALGVPKERTVLLGQSLGSGVAMELASRGLGARVVLVSPFTSMVDMARRVMPLLPVGLLVVDRYDSASKAPLVTQPALLVHGEADTLVPFEMSRRLVGLLPSAELYALPRAGHNDLWAVGGEALVERVTRFVREGR